jgi:hypothetical protein
MADVTVEARRERAEAFVGLRVEPGLRRELLESARRNGRSVSAEARAAFRRHLRETETVAEPRAA